MTAASSHWRNSAAPLILLAAGLAMAAGMLYSLWNHDYAGTGDAFTVSENLVTAHENLIEAHALLPAAEENAAVTQEMDHHLALAQGAAERVSGELPKIASYIGRNELADLKSYLTSLLAETAALRKKIVAEKGMPRGSATLVNTDLAHALGYALSARGEAREAAELILIHHRHRHTTIIALGAGAIFCLGALILLRERARREESGRAAHEALLSAVITSARDAIIMTDSRGAATFWNDAAERMFGYTAAEMMGQDISGFIIPVKYRQSHLSGLEAFRRTGGGHAIGKTLELEGLRKNGEVFPLALSLSSVRFHGHWHAVAVARDVSERRRAERMVSSLSFCGYPETGRDYFNRVTRHIASTLGAPYVFLGELAGGDRAYLRVISFCAHGELAAPFEYRLAQSPNEQTMKDSPCIVPRRAREAFPSDTMLAELGAESYIGALLRGKSGAPLGVLAALDTKPLENREIAESTMNVFAERVSAELERLRAEETHLRSEAQYRALFENSRDAIYMTRPEGRLVDANQAFLDLFGYTRGELLELSAEQLYADPADRLRLIELTHAQGGVKDMEIRFVRKNGDIVTCLVSGAARRDHEGNVIEYQAVVRDMTGRMLRDAELARLATAVSQTAEIIIVTDRDGLVQYVNPAFERLTGYPAREIAGQSTRLLKSGLHTPEFYKDMWDTILRGEVWTSRITNRRKDGRLIEVESSISPVFGADGMITNFVAVQRDVSREISLERRLRQTQKMEAIGTLAGGIAHDFNNILTSIIGYTELSLDEAENGSRMADNLAEILAASERARDLVRQILTFARKGEQERQPVEMSVVVKEALRLIRSIMPDNITLTPRLDPGPSRILGDPTQIHQVVMNLCSNAIHSMADTGGSLKVELDTVVVDKSTGALYPALKHGRYVRLAVGDTGHGMDKQTMERIFEPFFTLKPVGKGTGLGLTVVHGIVTNFAGVIDVASEPGKGSTFTLFFPLTTPDGEEAPRAETPNLPMGAGERVLLLDDESSVVNISGRIMARLGYLVESFTSAEEALAELARRPGEFDVIVTDQSMPGMSGDVFAERARLARPGIPIIITSGYSPTLSPERLAALGVSEFMLKPVNARELAAALRRALKDHPPSWQL
ncbi:MAG: PAS domain S-box protein [Nitrospinae bacterium]|nr:PAS domain S-box protein [Nitrospinota bacterium]